MTQQHITGLATDGLKFSAFQPEHAGQMEWYLKWLDKYERRPGEDKLLGIIICSDKEQEDVELMELGKNGLHGCLKQLEQAS